jgi:putative phosphoribosyl transferase
MVTEREVEVTTGPVPLAGILGTPENAHGVILFAHGSGSGRFSPRNNAVAHVLQDAGLATLLVDMLTEPESQQRRYVFDIGLLADRLTFCVAWLMEQPETRALPIGLFGASTGAGAALVAAAQIGASIHAIVSRGGRPDLAADYLPQVHAPTLLIVGGHDEPVIELNQQALAVLRSRKELVIVPGATHLFMESGALEEVSRLARDWFLGYLPR